MLFIIFLPIYSGYPISEYQLIFQKGQSFRAEVDVRFHHEDVLKKSKVQLSGSEGGVNASGGGDLPSDCPPACVSADPPDLDWADEGAAELTTRHYQRIQKAEDSWSKLREAQGSFSGKKLLLLQLGR